MNSRMILTAALLAGVLSYAVADDNAACGRGADQGKPACCCATDDDESPRDIGHPLKGVVQAVLADKQALLVKHEEIPGVMKAMTMMLRVAPAVLTQVKTGDPITATLHRSEDGVWYLDDVKLSTDS